MAVCSEIHTKHINTVCGQNVELLNVKLAVHIVTTVLQNVKSVVIPHNNRFPLQCHLNVCTYDSLPMDSQHVRLLPNNQCIRYWLFPE